MFGSFAVAIWLVCSVAVGQIARALGRSGVVWTLFSMICSPSIAIIADVGLLRSSIPAGRKGYHPFPD